MSKDYSQKGDYFEDEITVSLTPITKVYNAQPLPYPDSQTERPQYRWSWLQRATVVVLALADIGVASTLLVILNKQQETDRAFMTETTGQTPDVLPFPTTSTTHLLDLEVPAVVEVPILVEASTTTTVVPETTSTTIVGNFVYPTTPTTPAIQPTITIPPLLTPSTNYYYPPTSQHP